MQFHTIRVGGRFTTGFHRVLQTKILQLIQ
jgi:hypothetical protein